MADELKKKRKIQGGHKGYVMTTLERVKALLDELTALSEKLNVLGAWTTKFWF